MMAFKCARCDQIYGSHSSTCPECDHPVAKLVNDDDAVKEFAKRMANKLALSAEKGRDGWNGCSDKELSVMLREHVEKGDPIDVANFCMMLSLKGHDILPSTVSPEQQAFSEAAERAKFIEAFNITTVRFDEITRQWIPLNDTNEGFRTADRTAIAWLGWLGCAKTSNPATLLERGCGSNVSPSGAESR